MCPGMGICYTLGNLWIFQSVVTSYLITPRTTKHIFLGYMFYLYKPMIFTPPAPTDHLNIVYPIY